MTASLPIATATASDELPEVYRWIAWVFLPVGAIGAVAIFLSLIVLRRPSALIRWLCCATVVASAYPVGFSPYVYRIDFVAENFDGRLCGGAADGAHHGTSLSAMMRSKVWRA